MIKEIDKLDKAKISFLAEDTIEFDTPFWGRFGLSLLMELQSKGVCKTILYDTNSASEPIIHNLQILGKSVDELSAIFLSHCHYDHTDGLTGILEAIGRPIPVIAHPELFRPCFEINQDGIRHIGIVNQTRESFERRGATFTFTKDALNLMSGVTTSGEIERATSFEVLEDLYTIMDGKVVQDHERDDTAVILNLEEGLVIITGCCHAGIVNTMMHARKITGVGKVHAVIGGLHLIDASEEKITKSVEVLRDVDWVFAGHCTGFYGLQRIYSALGDRFTQIHTGSVIQLPIEDPENPVSTISTSNRDKFRF